MPLEVNCLLTYYVEIDSISKVFVRGGIEEQGFFFCIKMESLTANMANLGRREKSLNLDESLCVKVAWGWMWNSSLDAL